MSTTDRNTLTGWFVKGAKPLASQFAAWINSFWHKDDLIPVSSIEGLQEEFDKKAETSTVQTITQDVASVDNRVTNVEGSVTNLQRQITDLGTINKRSYTIDFNTDSELSQDSNLLGEITIDRILTKNVTELYVSYGSVVRQQVPTSGTVSLSIPDGVIITWEIVRSIEGELACVGIRFEILMEE